MKYVSLTVISLSLALTLAACGPKPEDKAAEAPAAVPAMPAMAEAPSAAKEVKGVGAVTAVDAAAGTITLDHGPIPEAGWPAMTMGFKAAPTLTQSVKVGDKVSFDLQLKDGSGEITAIRKK